MSKISADEVFQFIHSYVWKVDQSEVEQWLREDPLVQADSEGIMDESWMYRFNDWRQIKGTAYEPGIDTQTKINRLLEEVDRLKQEIEELKEKNLRLEKQLGIEPI
jgi:hypothetical protein